MNESERKLGIYDTKFGRYLLYNDDNISNVLIHDMFWEKDLKEIFDNYLNKDSTVIEVGSYIGDHTVYLSKSAKKVYAFESQRHIFHQLCANLFLNLCMNVYAREATIYDGSNLRLPNKDNHDPYAIPTHDYIEYGSDVDPSGIFLAPDIGGSITSVTLDSLMPIDERIDFILTDAEGSDLSILKGATNLISKWKPIIVYEFNITAANIHGDTFEDYERFFQSMGYRTEKVDFWNRIAIPIKE